MDQSFANRLKQLRTERNLSQQQMAELLYVDRSTIAKWENGNRIPDTLLLSRIAECLDIDMQVLLTNVELAEEIPNVILVDDEKIILSGGLPILEEVMPNASITGFTKPSDAIKYANSNRIALAFLDIEMGKISGFDLCRELLEINPRTNVIFLTAYMDYSLRAWDTGASGFVLKPLSAEDVRKQLDKLRYPIKWRS
ncbi:MAG: response regulator [Lachnospiraceae bacterium]|nr:response regulator [Lachnospiraceae bacterium]